MAVYNTTAPVGVPGEAIAPQCDVSGNLKVTSGGAGATADQVQGNVVHDAVDSGAPVKIGARAQSGAITAVSADGDRTDLLANKAGVIYVAASQYGGTTGGDGVNAVAAFGNRANTDLLAGLIPVLTAPMVYNGTTYDRSRGDTNGAYIVPKPVTSGGLSIARLVGATNGVIKASAGQLYAGVVTNTNAAIRYLQIYNKATAGTLSTDTPVLTVPLPPNVPVPINFSNLGGAFATGISWQFTTDNIAIPTTAGASTDIHGYCTYK